MKLITLLLLPIIGMIRIGTKRMESKEEIEGGMKEGLLISILILIWSIYIWGGMSSSTVGFVELTSISWDVMGKLMIGIDNISIYYILLTTLLMPICILASWNITKLQKEFILCILSLEWLLIGVFSVLDVLGFYILFEGTLIPMYIMIGVWGSRVEKVTASYYIFFYTLVGSLLMLLSIMILYKEYGTTDYLVLLNSNSLDMTTELIVLVGFLASLGVKIPSWPVHIWLPLAHVEAPVAGSVLLAGVLIKLGSYGFIRYTIPLLPIASKYLGPLIMTLGLIGVIYGSLTTLRQTDLKRVIAYSSVAHMGIVQIGIFTMTPLGVIGSIYLQLSHGLVSGALFIIVTLLYERYGSRLIKYYRGIVTTMPVYTTIFLFFTLANIAVPGTCNFIGEILCLAGIYEENMIVTILASLGMVLGASYALYLYNRVSFGSWSSYLRGSVRDITRREWHVLWPLILWTLVLGLYPNVILEWLNGSVLNLLEYTL